MSERTSKLPSAFVPIVGLSDPTFICGSIYPFCQCHIAVSRFGTTSNQDIGKRTIHLLCPLATYRTIKLFDRLLICLVLFHQRVPNSMSHFVNVLHQSAQCKSEQCNKSHKPSNSFLVFSVQSTLLKQKLKTWVKWN